MQTSNTVPFLVALQQVITDPGSMCLTDGDFFFLANKDCQPNEQLDYDHYLLYTTRLAVDVELSVAKLYNEVSVLIKAEVLKFKKLAGQEAFEDKPNWRRLVWMLNSRDRQQKLEQKQILAMYKAEDKPKELTKPKDYMVEPKQEAVKPSPVLQEQLEPVVAEPEKESTLPKYDLTTPLNEKWKKRFRPDWPWYIEETNTIHLTLAQLREIEAEIAAEKAEGINHPNDRFGYIPKGALYDEGFFTFTPNGYRGLPSCTYRPLQHLKESIRNTIAEQQFKGWVKGDDN